MKNITEIIKSTKLHSRSKEKINELKDRTEEITQHAAQIQRYGNYELDTEWEGTTHIKWDSQEEKIEMRKR